MKNFLSPENFSLSSSSQFKEIIKSSSEMNGCPVTNLLQSQTKSIWLSSENLPQEIILNLSSKYLISFPQKISAIGIYCWHAYPTNPKLVEIQISKNGIVFNSLGNFELCQKPGQQLFQLDDSLNIIDENGFISIKIIIKETFGGKRTYINNLYLYEEINYDNLNIKNDVSEESKNQLTNINEEDDSSSVIYLRESREKNLPRSNFSTIKSNIINNNNNNKFNSVLNTKIIQTDLSEDLLDLKSKELNVNLNNNNNNILTNVNNNNNNLTSNLFTSYNNILISDSELSEQKKIFNKDNTNFNYKNSTSQIIEVEEEKEKSSVFNSYKNSANKNKNFINNNINKINNSNNKNNNNNNNNILNEYINCNNNNSNENENDVIKYTELKTDYEIFKKMSKENFDKLSNKINKMETEINSLKLSIKNIENNLNLLVEEQNRQNQSNNFYILEECKNMINEKIVALLTNCNLNYINNNNNNNNNIINNNNNNEIYFNENDSYLSVPRQSNFTYYNLDDINSNNNINNQIENNNNNNDLLLEEINYNDEKDNNSQFNINNSPININNNNNNYNDSKLNDFEKKIDSQIEEKFQDFSNKLGKKITDSLLKPSIIQLENFMKGNLNEVKNSLRKVELLKNKKYYKFNNNIEENKNFTNKIIFNSLNTSNSNRRNNKTMFNNNNSNFNYNNNNNSSSANVSIK